MSASESTCLHDGHLQNNRRKEENMESINFLMIFDIVILGYGFFNCTGSVTDA